jgi:hypothetical protein
VVQYIISAPGCDGESPGIVPGYHEGAELYVVTQCEKSDFPLTSSQNVQVAINREEANEL